MKGTGFKMKPFKTTGRNRKKCAIVAIFGDLNCGMHNYIGTNVAFQG